MTSEAALRRALVETLAIEDVTANIGTIRSDAWASATFTGVRHELRLRLSGRGVDAAIAGISEREFDLPGHILIDIAATEMSRDHGGRWLALEALTVTAD
jgi:hypothetical protein